MILIKNEFKDRIECFNCDVTKEEDVKNAIDKTVELWGTIHVAIACAGVVWPVLTISSKGSMDSDKFKKVIDINLYGSIYMAKYASILMSKNKPINDKGEKGVLIFVSSVAAEEG
jgi:3-hydroxyacyl-CoA dehydrogenase/3-hydroxy-2-methylbutyryl-CoA dehydrogenase